MTPPDPLGALGHFPLVINKPLQQSYALRLCVCVRVRVHVPSPLPAPGRLGPLWLHHRDEQSG